MSSSPALRRYVRLAPLRCSIAIMRPCFSRAHRPTGWSACVRICVSLAHVQLREKREELNKSIAQDEEEKGARANPSFAPSMQTRDFIDRHGGGISPSGMLRSKDPERPAHPDGAAGAHQRQPRAQGLLAYRVRQNHHRGACEAIARARAPARLGAHKPARFATARGASILLTRA